MKLFKRSKDATGNGTARPSPEAGPGRKDSGDLLPGMLAALAGVAAAGALLWFGVLVPSEQSRVGQLAQAWGDSQASALRQAITQLQADTAAAARDPSLIDALNSGDAERLMAAERSLGYRDGVIDAHLNLPGQAQQNSQRAAPMNFAALDLLRRLEGGRQPSPEAYKVGERWLIYSAAPLRQNDQSAPRARCCWCSTWIACCGACRHCRTALANCS